MQKIISRGLYGLLFAGGITLLGATAANAADTTGEDGVASGTLIEAPVTVPVTLDGNAISLIGDSTANGGRAASSPTIAAPTDDASTTSGEDGIGSGNVVSPDVVAPVGVTGNSITLIGDSSATSSSDAVAAPVASKGDAAATNGDDGIASGNLMSPDAVAPIGVTGNSITLIGDSRARGSSGEESADAAPVTRKGQAAAMSGEDGIASGNLVSPGMTAPVQATGNMIAVLGDSMLGQPAVSESTESSQQGKAERSVPGKAATSDEGKAAASDEGIVRRGPVSLIGHPNVSDVTVGAVVSERHAGSDPVATGPGATSPDATGPGEIDSNATPPALAPCDISVAGPAGAVLASATTPTGTSPAEMLLLVMALLFGGATAGLLWKVNRM
ncbi:chaplin family protein [Diaminobutyricimonas sp. TR449]|uniref:chaplin family protein n=1 Tax=Diaminobutyricimonas sp. TR449 TaxID=2708076 RepID=UPI001421BF0E|nr:chaplin family protein [Diaminobutyricimonas sp. TR449]